MTILLKCIVICSDSKVYTKNLNFYSSSNISICSNRLQLHNAQNIFDTIKKRTALKSYNIFVCCFSQQNKQLHRQKCVLLGKLATLHRYKKHVCDTMQKLQNKFKKNSSAYKTYQLKNINNEKKKLLKRLIPKFIFSQNNQFD